jgi:hypothetical protein
VFIVKIISIHKYTPWVKYGIFKCFETAGDKTIFFSQRNVPEYQRTQRSETSCKSWGGGGDEIAPLNVEVSRFMTQEAYFVLAHVVLVGADPAGPPSSIEASTFINCYSYFETAGVGTRVCLPCPQFNSFYCVVSSFRCTKWNYVQNGGVTLLSR